MNVFDSIRVVVYRFHEKGMEIFLVDDKYGNKNIWKVDELNDINPDAFEDVIDMHTTLENGEKVKIYAIEGEWHDIPSIRKMINTDVQIVKNQLKKSIPGVEKGGFIAVKEAFKKLLPEEYKVVKEIKDIISDRNTTKYI